MPVPSDLNYFTEEEFDHPDKMDETFLRWLDTARAIADIPFHITSDWRDADRSKSHHLGKAVDIACGDSSSRWIIVDALIATGFKRIGIYDRHIHVDDNTIEDGFPQNVMWVGKSR